jgi:hypothetical protein
MNILQLTFFHGLIILRFMSQPTSPHRIAATLQAGGKAHQYFDLKALDAKHGGKVRLAGQETLLELD